MLANNLAVSLFSRGSLQQNLSFFRVSFSASDGLPPHVCEKYKRRPERKTGSEDTGGHNPRLARLKSYTNTG